MIIYATTGDLETWMSTSTVPTNAAELLRSATLIVARAANRNPYTDVPTTDDATVLRDATTAQVAAWIALNVDPNAAGIDTAPVKSRKIGTADVTYDTTGADQARLAAATEIAPEAKKILLAGGLFALDLPYWTSDSDRLLHYGIDRPFVLGVGDIEHLNEIDAL